MQCSYEQQTTLTRCGWCSKKATTRHQAHTHATGECPELAKTRCGFCRQFGHTTGHCSIRKERNREWRWERRQAAQVCDWEGGRICRGKVSVPTVQSKLVDDNPYTACALMTTSDQAQDHQAQDRYECEKCGFQHSCLEIVEEHEASCSTGKTSWADIAEDSDDDIGAPVWDDEQQFPSLSSTRFQ